MKSKILIIILALLIYTLLFGKDTVMLFTRYVKGDSWNKMLPELKEAVTKTIDDLNSRGIDAVFYEGYRTIEKSQEMIDKGTSKLKNADSSDHVWGIGADIVKANAFGFATWPEVDNDFWKQLHTTGAKYGLEFYISWDKPHARLKGYTVAMMKGRKNT